MTSKNSTYKIPFWTLMRDDLRHRTWMIAVSVLSSFVTLPVAFLLVSDKLVGTIDPSTAGRGNMAHDILYSLTDYLVSGHTIMQIIAIFLLAVTLSVYGFRHLYSRRMADLFHSMPVTRNRSFLAVWLNGFLIWLLPFLLGNLCLYVMSLFLIGDPALWGNITLMFLLQPAMFTLCFLIVYNACLVAVMVSGNVTNAIVNLLIYGLIVLMAYLTVFSYVDCYFETYYYDRGSHLLESAVTCLTPFLSPILLCMSFADNTMLRQWGGAIIASAVFMALNFLLAMYLHGRRPSDLAERGLENKWFCIPFRFVASCLAGLLLALLFWATNNSLGWYLFGAVFGSFLSFAILNIIYHASFKAALKHKLQLALSVLLTCGTVLFFYYDWSGYDGYLPAQETITGLALHIGDLGDTGDLLRKNEDGTYVRVSDDNLPRQEMFTGQDEIHRLLEAMVLHEPHTTINKGQHTSHPLDVRVYTTNGSYCRHYNFHTAEKDWESLRPFVESETFRDYFYPASSGVMDPPSEITIGSLDDVSCSITDKERIDTLYEAYAKDFIEHYSMESAFANSAFPNMHYYYPIAGESNPRGLSVYIAPWYDNTIALLEEWYPGQTWSPDGLNLLSLKVSIRPTESGTDPADYLSQYLGVEIPGTAAPGDTSSPDGSPGPAADDDSSSSWNAFIDDPELLEELRPYLIIARTKSLGASPGYAYIGKLETSLRTDISSRTSTYFCYVEYGKIPAKLLEQLKWTD